MKEQVERHRLVLTWIEHVKKHCETGRVPDSTFWAVEKLWEIRDNDPDLCWELILEILSVDQSPAVIENLAAGPLEDLLDKHGPRVIDRVEAQAKTNPLFKDLLGGVWRSTIAQPIWDRVQAVAGERW